MTRLLKPAHLFLGTLLIAASASSKATGEEYRWGTTVCTPTSSKVARSFSDGKMETYLYAPAASCRCEKDPAERRKVEVRVDMNSSKVTVSQTDETGKKSLWDQFGNCKIISSTDWDCSGRDLRFGNDAKLIRKASSDQGIFLIAHEINSVETVGTIKGENLYGSCIKKGGWSLKGLISQ